MLTCSMVGRLDSDNEVDLNRMLEEKEESSTLFDTSKDMSRCGVKDFTTGTDNIVFKIILV